MNDEELIAEVELAFTGVSKERLELFARLAQEHNVDLGKLSDELIEHLYAETFKHVER